jgi:hypothetical protein
MLDILICVTKEHRLIQVLSLGVKYEYFKWFVSLTLILTLCLMVFHLYKIRKVLTQFWMNINNCGAIDIKFQSRV